MNKIQEIFNFNNIGDKLKTWAQWSCWISIALVWIVAVVSFILCLFAKGMFLVALAVPVSAALTSLFIWVGSWMTYAFGDLVNNIRSMHKKEEPTTHTSTTLPPPKDIFAHARENASKAPVNTVKRCPYCGDVVKLGRCTMCGKES